MVFMMTSAGDAAKLLGSAIAAVVLLFFFGGDDVSLVEDPFRDRLGFLFDFGLSTNGTESGQSMESEEPVGMSAGTSTKSTDCLCKDRSHCRHQEGLPYWETGSSRLCEAQVSWPSGCLLWLSLTTGRYAASSGGSPAGARRPAAAYRSH